MEQQEEETGKTEEEDDTKDFISLPTKKGADEPPSQKKQVGGFLSDIIMGGKALDQDREDVTCHLVSSKEKKVESTMAHLEEEVETYEFPSINELLDDAEYLVEDCELGEGGRRTGSSLYRLERCSV